MGLRSFCMQKIRVIKFRIFSNQLFGLKRSNDFIRWQNALTRTSPFKKIIISFDHGKFKGMIFLESMQSVWVFFIIVEEHFHVMQMFWISNV